LLAECLANAPPARAARAEQALERALQIAPAHPFAMTAWRKLAVARFRLGKYPALREAVEHAVLLESAPEQRALLALLAAWADLFDAENGRPERAIETLTLSLAEAPGSAEWALSQWTLGVAFDLLQDQARAWRHLSLAGAWRGDDPSETALEAPVSQWLSNSERAYFRGLWLLLSAQHSEASARVSLESGAQLQFLGYQAEARSEAVLGRLVAQHMHALRRRLQSP
jgi:tetratricopeptide (TPR) repeat protein